MRRLILSEEIFRRITALALGAPSVEVGVTLFGVRSGGDAYVTEIAPPGPQATMEYAHYSGDNDHASALLNELLRENPDIKWLGELHAHPAGMTRLSRGDLRTVKEILTGTDDTYHPDEFIAGVIQRTAGLIAIYPIHFTKTTLTGEEMEVFHGADVLKKQEGARRLIAKAYRYCRPRQWRKCHRRDGSANGSGPNHPH